MDVFEAMESRRSYRGAFLDRNVPRPDLRKIVEAGIRAPSGCNAQTTSFVIVDDADVIERIHAIVDRPVVGAAKAVIVCVVDPRGVFHGKSFGVEDCAAAVENMLLAVTALGYATVWIDGVLRDERKAERIAELLGIPDNLQVRVILPLGVSAEPGEQREKEPFEARAWFNGFQRTDGGE